MTGHQVINDRDLSRAARETREWNEYRFTGDVRETSERRGGAHMGFSERIDTILN